MRAAAFASLLVAITMMVFAIGASSGLIFDQQAAADNVKPTVASVATPAVIATQTASTPVPDTPTPTPVTPAPTPITPVPTKVSPTPTPVTPTPVPATPVATPATPTPDANAAQMPDGWQQAMKLQDGAIVGTVSSGSLNIRSAPSTSASIVGVTYDKHPITIYQAVKGDAVEGNTTWFRIGDGQFVSSALVKPFVYATPKTAYTGHWLDINLTRFYAIAYDGTTPVHVAIIITGTEGNGTPAGQFQIIRRVANETMDSATVGVPKGSPGYYLLKNVKWTQYFADGGFAIHTNYWSSPAAYGTYGSHGCVNMMEADAYFMWNFLNIGSPVSSHF